VFDPVGSGYTHFEFKARIGATDKQSSFLLTSKIHPFVTVANVDISSPVYSNEQPTTADRWSVFRVPLSDLGLVAGMNLDGIFIMHGGDMLLDSYYDGIQFASYTSSMKFYYDNLFFSVY